MIDVALLGGVLTGCGDNAAERQASAERILEADGVLGTADEAQVHCEEWVKERLKAPSTAQFDDVAVDVQDRSWRVVGKIDAENSFGGTARTDFTCVTQSDVNGAWTLISLDVN